MFLVLISRPLQGLEPARSLQVGQLSAVEHRVLADALAKHGQRVMTEETRLLKEDEYPSRRNATATSEW